LLAITQEIVLTLLSLTKIKYGYSKQLFQAFPILFIKRAARTSGCSCSQTTCSFS
jgi:hypothetical protein